MKSDTVLDKKYAKYVPQMSLATYEEQLPLPNGTHPSLPCSPDRGSFLACYLEDAVIDHADGLAQLEKDAPTIDRLIQDPAKQCQIIFNESKQLHIVFEKLKNNLPLYLALLKKGYLTSGMRCQNGNTFLHDFLQTLNLTDTKAIETACELIGNDQSGLVVSGAAGYPITILLNKLKQGEKNLSPENQQALCHLLKLCQLRKTNYILSHETQSDLLRTCFELFGVVENQASAILAFEAVLAAASIGMPLHQPLKGCVDDETALFAYLMELDASYEWGMDGLRRLMKVANSNLVKVGVKINPQAVMYERSEVQQPEDIESYVYIDNFTDDECEKQQAHRILSAECLKSHSNYRFVPQLAVASQIYTVSSIIATWKGELSIRSVMLGQVSEGRYDEVIDLTYVSEAYLPKDSPYREQIAYVKPKNDGEPRYINGTLRPKYQIYSESGYYSSRCTLRQRNSAHDIEDKGDLPKALLSAKGADELPKVFSKMHNVFYVFNNRKVLVANYYHRYFMIPTSTVRKNALLAYLEKGGEASDARAAHPTMYCHDMREFVRIDDRHPRLVRFSPGKASSLTAIYKCEQTGEVLLQSTEQAPVIQRYRVYDLELFKAFKHLGFDFSVPDVTAWISRELQQKALSPEFYQLLACLKECGAVFPKKVGEQDYIDFMTEKLKACNAEYEAWFERFSEMQNSPEKKSFLVAHLAALELSFDLSPEAMKVKYIEKFGEKWLGLIKSRVEYPVLLAQWLEAIQHDVVDGRHEFYGDFPGIMACLNAYIESGDFNNEKMDYAQDYAGLFMAVIDERLRVLSLRIDEAKRHRGENKSRFVGWVSEKKRSVVVGSDVEALKDQIDEITGMSPQNHQELLLKIETYSKLNHELKNNMSFKSKAMNNCLMSYKTEEMFKTWVFRFSPLVKENIVAFIKGPLKLRLLPFFETNAALAMLVSVSPSAPPANPEDQPVLYPFVHGFIPPQVGETYHPKNGNEKMPPSSMPSAPPIEEPSEPTFTAPSVDQVHQEITAPASIYPSAKEDLNLTLFKEKCAAYSKAIDACYAIHGIEIHELNARMIQISENSEAMPYPVSMLICQNTKQFAKYPCIIDNNSMIYYDLDHVLACLASNQTIDGVNGILTVDRISFRALSEIQMMTYVLKTVQYQLAYQSAAQAYSYAPEPVTATQGLRS